MGEISLVFWWIYHTMDSMVLSVGNFSFSLLEVAWTVIFLSLVGYVIHAFMTFMGE